MTTTLTANPIFTTVVPHGNGGHVKAAIGYDDGSVVMQKFPRECWNYEVAQKAALKRFPNLPFKA